MFYTSLVWGLYLFGISETVSMYKNQIIRHRIGKHILKSLSQDDLFYFTRQVFSFTFATVVVMLTGLSLMIMLFNGENIFGMGALSNMDYFIGQLTVGYFIIDTLIYILAKGDKIYIIHHLVSIKMGYLILNSGYGKGVIIIGLFLGEITNPIQKIWELTKYNKSPHFTTINNLYTPFFTIIRAFVFPYVIYNLLYETYINNDIGLLHKFSIMSDFFAIQIGSWYWCYLLSKGFIKYHRKQK